MTVAEMRCAIYDIYPGDKWHKKVENMPDNQVTAVYFRFLAKGQFSPTKDLEDKIVEAIMDEQTFKPFIGEQLTLF